MVRLLPNAKSIWENPSVHMGIIIRNATDADLPAIVAIVNREIAESPYIYAEVPVTTVGWAAAHRAGDLPVLVAEDDGAREVLGWTSLSPYRSSSGYRFTAELSIFVRRDLHRRGIASRLLAELHAIARARGLHALVGSVDSDNAPSLALLAKFGFVEAARLPEVGRKFDVWRTQLLLLHVLR